jgi:hypothetical protein
MTYSKQYLISILEKPITRWTSGYNLGLEWPWTPNHVVWFKICFKDRSKVKLYFSTYDHANIFSQLLREVC